MKKLDWIRPGAKAVLTATYGWLAESSVVTVLAEPEAGAQQMVRVACQEVELRVAASHLQSYAQYLRS